MTKEKLSCTIVLVLKIAGLSDKRLRKETKLESTTFKLGLDGRGILTICSRFSLSERAVHALFSKLLPGEQILVLLPF